MISPSAAPIIGGPSSRSASDGGRAGPLNGDFDASIRRPALRRVIRSFRMSLAEAFGRNDIGVDALRHQEGYYRRRAACRQHQIVGNTLSLQRGSDGRIVGIAVDDYLGVLETPQLWGDI